MPSPQDIKEYGKETKDLLESRAIHVLSAA